MESETNVKRYCTYLVDHCFNKMVQLVTLFALRVVEFLNEKFRIPSYCLGLRRSGSTAHEGGGCDQLIGSTVSDAIVWSTSTRSSQLGYLVDYCK